MPLPQDVSMTMCGFEMSKLHVYIHTFATQSNKDSLARGPSAFPDLGFAESASAIMPRRRTFSWPTNQFYGPLSSKFSEIRACTSPTAYSQSVRD